MNLNSFFAFSFGGNNDFGDKIMVNEKFNMEFSSKPYGIGFAIRDKIEADFDGKKKIAGDITVTSDIDLTVEFKTERSHGAPETVKSISLKEGKNSISVAIPENLSSSLNEIVLFFKRKERVLDVEILFDVITLE